MKASVRQSVVCIGGGLHEGACPSFGELGWRVNEGACLIVQR